MTQRIDGKEHQITHKGNIINCHGGPDCPLNVVPESRLQSEFAQRVGIWCRREAREFLELLMKDHGFIGKDLALAWKADSLAWGDDGPVICTPLTEALFGWSMGLLMVTCYLLLVWPLWVMEHRDAQAMLTFILMSAIFLGCSWLLGRFVMRPRRVALRVRRALAAL